MKKPVKTFMSILMVLSILITMFPVPVQAASAGIKQDSCSIQAGESVALKTTGTYKSVTFKTSKPSVASVTRKGKVTGKKAGTATVTATFKVKKGKKTKTVKDSCKVTVYEAVPSVDVSSCDAAQIHNDLIAGKGFFIKASKNKAKSKQQFEELQRAVGKANGYGVLFKYDLQKQNGVWYAEITENTCILYQDSVRFFEKVVDKMNDRYGGSCKEEASRFDNPDDYIAYQKPGWDDDDIKRLIHQWTREWVFYHTKFCDLSSAMQVWALSESHICGAFNGAESNYGTDMRNMSNLANGTASGLCESYTRHAMSAFRQLGIPVEYKVNENKSHAWCVVTVTNADGTEFDLVYNNGSISENNGLYAGELNRDKFPLIY